MPLLEAFLLAGAAASGLIARYIHQRWEFNRERLNLVRPQHSDRFEGLSEPLSGLDELSSEIFNCFALCFDSLLDANKLREALSVTLDAFPAFSGRLQSPHTISDFSAGAIFEVIERSEADARLYTSSRDWERVGAVFSHGGLSRPGPRDPLFQARVTLFSRSGVSVLGVAVNHALGDASSIVRFLQTWSFHCGGQWPSQPPPPPQPLGLRRQLQFASDEGPATLEELRAADPALAGMMDREKAKRAQLSILWAVLRHRVMEIRIDAAELKIWKQRVTEMLPAGERVSSFAVLYASLLFASLVANGQEMHKPVAAIPVVDARGRVSKPTTEFCGNLLLGERVVLRVGAQVESTQDVTAAAVADLAMQLHAGVQRTLAKGDELLYSFKWFNRVQDLGYGGQLGYTLFGDGVAGDLVLLNSWCNFRLEVDMGTGIRASRLVTPSAALRNFWTLAPHGRESGDMTVHIAMGRAQSEVFLRTIAEAKMPFHLVESFRP